MSGDITISHVIPQIGFTTIPLYSPADKVYKKLKNKEIYRLNSLRHLGVLSHAFPGTRQARWDYTVSILYYVMKLKVRGMNSSFRISNTEFSSAQAALQTIALIWNIGHLPGTFAVEKGVYRFLYSNNNEAPASVLEWPHREFQGVDIIIKEANRFLKQYDFLALSRVLAVIKLLSLASNTNNEYFEFVINFAAPFLLDYQKDNSRQWPKLHKAFSIARHLAYLTLDAPISGLQWGPSVPALLEHQISKGSLILDELYANISEILSPIERMTYDAVYHSDLGRREVSVIADHVSNLLESAANPNRTINTWLFKGLFRDLKLGRRLRRDNINRVGDIRLRSHFAASPEVPIVLEKSLKSKGFTHPVVFEYRAWSPDILLEPDEIIIDVLTSEVRSTNDIGKLILWVIDKFEDLTSKVNDYIYMSQKIELESSYRSLVARAFELTMQETSVEYNPWPLSDFGLFGDVSIPHSKGGVWTASAGLDDDVVKHIVRDRSKNVPGYLKAQYAELLGLRDLRKRIRQQQKAKERRHRWILITGSLILRREANDVIA